VTSLFIEYLNSLADNRDFRSALRQVAQRLGEMALDHPLASGLCDFPYAYDNLYFTEFIKNKKNPRDAYHHQGVPLWALPLFNFAVSILHHREHYTLHNEAEARESGVRSVRERTTSIVRQACERSKLLRGRAIYANVKEPQKQHLLNAPVFVPDRGQKISTFVMRLLRTFELAPDHMFAAQVLLWTPNRVQNVQRFYDCNIMLPWGGINARPNERQWAYSMVAFALNPGPVGIHWYSRRNVFSGFGAGAKQFYVQMDQRVGYVVNKPAQKLTMAYVRAGAHLGGCDSRYIDQRQRLTRRMSSTAFLEMMANGQGSTLAILGSWAEACQPRGLPNVVSLLGHHLYRDYVRELPFGDQFSTEQERFQFSGVAFHNFVHRWVQNGVTMTAVDPTKFNFNQQSLARQQNFTIKQGSVRVYCGTTVSKQRVTDSWHEWGRVMPGHALVSCGRAVLKIGEQKSWPGEARDLPRLTI